MHAIRRRGDSARSTRTRAAATRSSARNRAPNNAAEIAKLWPSLDLAGAALAREVPACERDTRVENTGERRLQLWFTCKDEAAGDGLRRAVGTASICKRLIEAGATGIKIGFGKRSASCDHSGVDKNFEDHCA